MAEGDGTYREGPRVGEAPKIRHERARNDVAARHDVLREPFLHSGLERREIGGNDRVRSASSKFPHRRVQDRFGESPIARASMVLRIILRQRARKLDRRGDAVATYTDAFAGQFRARECECACPAVRFLSNKKLTRRGLMHRMRHDGAQQFSYQLRLAPPRHARSRGRVFRRAQAEEEPGVRLREAHAAYRRRSVDHCRRRPRNIDRRIAGVGLRSPQARSDPLLSLGAFGLP